MADKSPKGFVDWNEFTLDKLVQHLEREFGPQSSGTSKAVFELIRFYKKHKQEKPESQDMLKELAEKWVEDSSFGSPEDAAGRWMFDKLVEAFIAGAKSKQ